MTHNITRWTALVVSLLVARPAMALEPLAELVRAARTRNFDAREQDALTAQRQDEAREASWKLAPVVSASAGYTRNQYAAIVTIPSFPGSPGRSAAITRQDQLDATFTAAIPIIDVGAWERVGAARRTAAAAVETRASTQREIERAVAQAYYEVVAEEAVRSEANARRDTANANLAFVRTRFAAGVAPELDLRRATAELESARQAIADAEYQVKIARRSLATLTGVEPSLGSPALEADLAEAPVGPSNVDDLPSVRAATATARAAERTVNATRAGLYPTISGTATERFTNAPGFGKEPYYALGVLASWRFDGGTFASTAAADHAAELARIREERVRRDAEDTWFDARSAVERQIEKARSARAQKDASALAANIAHQRYEAGTANYLDVQTAERDDFSAKVALIQASADLAYARVALRVAGGR